MVKEIGKSDGAREECWRMGRVVENGDGEVE